MQVDEEAGNQGSIISIRGMQGDGVSVRIDGAPQNFNQVRHGGANTVWAEPDLYKTITVIPGAASNIYGNGSLGGVVKLETIDPDDLLGEETAAVTVRAGHETNGNAFVRSVEGAYQLTDSLSGLAYVLMRDNGAYEDGSGTETLGGATGSEDTNFLVKVSFTREAHTLEAARRSLAKEYTARGTQSRGRVASAPRISSPKSTTRQQPCNTALHRRRTTGSTPTFATRSSTSSGIEGPRTPSGRPGLRRPATSNSKTPRF